MAPYNSLSPLTPGARGPRSIGKDAPNFIRIEILYIFSCLLLLYLLLLCTVCVLNSLLSLRATALPPQNEVCASLTDTFQMENM